MLIKAFTVIVKVLAVLVHKLAFLTVKLPVYVPAAAFAGTVMLIAFAGKVALLAATKVFVGIVFQVRL